MEVKAENLEAHLNLHHQMIHVIDVETGNSVKLDNAFAKMIYVEIIELTINAQHKLIKEGANITILKLHFHLVNSKDI